MGVNVSESSYPLQWPAGWPRTKHPSYAKFGQRSSWTNHRAADALEHEVQLLCGRYSSPGLVISSNIGGPRNTQPSDVGVAAYFTFKKQRLAFACDKWNRVEHNLVAIAKHVEALRGQERWGVGSLERSFLGYAALPPGPDAKPTRPWREVLGFPEGWTPPRAIIEAAYRDKSKELHPDVGGDSAGFNELTRARDEALRSITDGAIV